MRARKNLSRIGVTLFALSAITLGTGCHSSGRTYRTTALAPVRSDSTPSISSAGRTGSGSQITEGDSKIVIPLYEETLRVGTRQVEAGGVRIRKEVTTDTVTQPIEVRRETLVIDRLPADSPAADGQAQFSGASTASPFEEKEIEIRLMREEPVVEKQVVQVGQIVAEKRSQTAQTNVQREVRRENIDVSRFGNAENVIISENLRQSSPNTATGGTGISSERASGTAASGSAITSLQSITTEQESTLVGRPVRLSGVTVQQVIGDKALLLESQGSQVLARTSQPISGITQGDKVQVTGTIQKMPESISALGIDATQIPQVQNQRVYVEAQNIKSSQQ